ncbi:hypothetical protein ARMGADRAFT_1091325 [Armillaria gallica]|uniref:Uncharacterized protein n=1 Tax=Armillaria gallica TaxID=47427 RepID=A0A2H3CEB6_ARMGA|nr:hypothetical protein ARMGADRAFT_1091325 [Armillaria gallica]
MAAPNLPPISLPILVAGDENYDRNDRDACLRVLNALLEAYHIGPDQVVVTEADTTSSINALVDALNFYSATITAGINETITSLVEMQET